MSDADRLDLVSADDIRRAAAATSSADAPCCWDAMARSIAAVTSSVVAPAGAAGSLLWQAAASASRSAAKTETAVQFATFDMEKTNPFSELSAAAAAPIRFRFPRPARIARKVNHISRGMSNGKIALARFSERRERSEQ